MVQIPVHRLVEQSTVVELIYDGYPCWKDNILKKLFSLEEVNIIKSIPISLYGREERIKKYGIILRNVFLLSKLHTIYTKLS